MYKCSICKSDTKYDEFLDYVEEVCINCGEEYEGLTIEEAEDYRYENDKEYAEDYAQRKGEWQ